MVSGQALCRRVSPISPFLRGVFRFFTFIPRGAALDCQSSNLTNYATTLHSTIGAGDTFNAGMLYACMARDEDWDLGMKLEFANELAGRKVVQEGFQGLGKVMKQWL